MRLFSGRSNGKFLIELLDKIYCRFYLTFNAIVYYKDGDNAKGNLIDAITGQKNGKRKLNDVSDAAEDDAENDSKPLDLSNAKDEEINGFRNKLSIRIRGTDCPHPCATFSSMNIDESIKSIVLANIEKSSWKEPTPIQMQAIPAFLNKRDLLASAPTGSGKTAAYVIPILSKIAYKLKKTTGDKEKQSKSIQSLIIAPTKELAEQIYNETSFLCQGKRIKVKILKKASSSVQQVSNLIAVILSINCFIL